MIATGSQVRTTRMLTAPPPRPGGRGRSGPRARPGVGRSPGSASPTEAASRARTPAGDSPRAARSASVTAPWRLARRAPSGPSISGTWAWRGRGQAEPRAEPELARGGVEQVRSAHDLPDTLLGVVDNDREVVGERAVVAADDEVVDDALDRPAQAVLERDARAAGAHAQRGRPAARPPGRALGGAQAQAGARVGALRAAPRAAPRPPRGSPRACTSTRTPGPAPRGARAPRRSSARALGLADDRAVPVQPERPQVGELLAPRSSGRTRPASRSSTRTRKRASWLRANSQASSAVRRLPRCRLPVGLGAKRPSASTSCSR